MRGRREATSLARCRAQIEHRTRDGRRIRRCRARCHVRGRRSGQQSRPAHTQQPAAQSGAERVPVADSDLRREQNQIVRIKWVRISVTFTRTVNAGADANDALTDSDTVTGSDGVSDPSGHARGHWRRAHRGRSRHRSSCDTDRGSSSGGKGRRPSRGPRRTSGQWNIRRFNGLEDGFRMGGRQQGDPDEAD